MTRHQPSFNRTLISFEKMNQDLPKKEMGTQMLSGGDSNEYVSDYDSNPQSKFPMIGLVKVSKKLNLQLQPETSFLPPAALKQRSHSTIKQRTSGVTSNLPVVDHVYKKNMFRLTTSRKSSEAQQKFDYRNHLF